MKRLLKPKIEYVLLFGILLLGFLARLQYDHPPDFDSYWLHAMANSILKYGYAKWVFHPASLFGYYPLSYPSGLIYLLAFLSEITGLSMNSIIFLAGISQGLCATLLVYDIGRRIFNKKGAFFSALVFTLSPQLVYYSTNVASGRMTLILFYLILLKFFIHLFDARKHFLKKIFPYFKLSLNLIKYLFVITLTIVYLFLIHRTAQLVLLILFAIAAGIGYVIISKLIPGLNKLNVIKKLFLKRYKISKLHLFIDLVLVIFALAVIKAIDLIIRKRFMINLLRMLDKINNGFDKLIEIYASYSLIINIGFLSVALILTTLIIYIKFIKKIRLISVAEKFLDLLYFKIKQAPEKSLNFLFLFILISLFILQFFGKSFYSPSLDEYTSSALLRGNNPIIIFLNFLINYHTSVTISFMFIFFGAAHLALKKGRTLLEDILLFVAILFSGILVDTRYVRLFVTPILALLIGYGISQLHDWSINRYWSRKIFNLGLFILILLLFVGAFSQNIRTEITGQTDLFMYREEFDSIGYYFKSFDKEFSTITTRELNAGVQIYRASDLPGATHNVFYYVNKSYLVPESRSLSEDIDILVQGRKLERLWVLPDWIFGGEYYVGRHARYLYEQNFNSNIVRRMIEDYNEWFYVHDKDDEPNKFYLSIVPIYNKIYDNPKGVVYDIHKGRVLP